MRPWANPVFQEAVTIYWKEGQAYVSYLFYVGILGALQVLALVLPAGEARFWIGPAFLFKFSTVAALLLIVYLTLRFAGLEFLAWRFSPLRHWLEEERLGVVAVASGLLAILVVHGLILLFLAAPLLAWSGAIARAPLGDMASTLPMLFLYAVGYGIWGLVGLALWERKPDSRRVFIRWIFVCFFLISGAFGAWAQTLNPVAFLLYHLGTLEMTTTSLHWGLVWTPPLVHWTFQGFIFTVGLTLLAWGLKRIQRGYS